MSLFFWKRIDTSWKESPAHLELLTKFLKSCNPNDIYSNEQWSSEWERVLSENPRKAINRLIDQKILVVSSLHQRLDFIFTLIQLKDLAKERNLKVSGKKDELIQRLIQHNENEMIKLAKGPTIYSCSNEGKIYAEEYKQRRKMERLAYEQNVLEAFKKCDINKAVNLARDYYINQIFQPGIGVDYNEPSTVEWKKKSLEVIFSGSPKILAGLPAQDLNQLQILAAMSSLWGGSSIKTWIPEGFHINHRFTVEVASRMVLFYASNKCNLLDCEKSDIVIAIEISSASDTCQECKKFEGKKFNKHNVPELPNPHCTDDNYGCRCTYIPVTKSYERILAEIYSPSY